MFIEFAITKEKGDPNFYFPYKKIGVALNDKKIINEVTDFIDIVFLDNINNAFATLKNELQIIEKESQPIHSSQKIEMPSYSSRDRQKVTCDFLKEIKTKGYKVCLNEKEEGHLLQFCREKIEDKSNGDTFIYFFE